MMYPNPLAFLQAHNNKFVLHADYEQQKTEVFNLVLNEPNVVEFELMMALRAYKTKTNQRGLGRIVHEAFMPDPAKYLSVSAEELSSFFSRISKVTVVVNKLQKEAEAVKASEDSDSHVAKKQRVEYGSEKQFIEILHFILFTSNRNMYEISTPWYRALQNDRVIVLSFAYSAEEEVNFKRRSRDRHFYFHGTRDNYVYSILRNGIQPTAHSQKVYMSDSIDYALNYSGSRNKVLLCFEVLSRNSLAPFLVMSFKPSAIRLKALIWTDSAQVISRVAANVVNDLVNGIQQVK